METLEKPVRLKDNIFLQSFDSGKSWRIQQTNYAESSELALKFGKKSNFEILYSGLVSDIPEEIAKECVNSCFFVSDIIGGGETCYENYSEFDCWLNTAKESIQSACSKEFCIIYKTNQ